MRGVGCIEAWAHVDAAVLEGPVFNAAPAGLAGDVEADGGVVCGVDIWSISCFITTRAPGR